MRAKPMLLPIAVVGVLWAGFVGPAGAQSVWPNGAPASADLGYPPPAGASRRPEITVTPRPLLYRQCRSWLELQYRPSGTVLFPRKRCWWVRG